MAEPPDPTMPGGPIDEPGDDANGWVRPSQRRPSKPGPSKPGPSQSRPSPRRPSPRRASTPAEPPADALDFPPPPDDPADATEPVAATAATRASTATRRHRRPRDRNRRRAAMGAGALALVVAIVAALLITSGGGSSKASSPPLKASLVTASPTRASHPAAVVLTTKVPSLQVFDQPSATGKVVTTLTAKTDYLQPRTLLATTAQPNWFQVLLPIRPNSSKGWVRATDVTTATTDYEVRIVLSTHHLTLLKAGTPVLATQAVIGKHETPTPTGLFYVTDPVDLQAQPHGPYGVFALGLSGFSDVLQSFNGGPGQIAVHGTPYADQVGQDLSNGCVRIPDPLILMIAKTVPLGTPVTITA